MIPFLSTPVMVGLAAVAVVGLAGAGVQTLRLSWALGELKDERLVRSQEHTAAALALASAQADNIETQTRWQANVDEQRKGLEDAKRHNQQLADELVHSQLDAMDADELRRKLTAARGAAATSSLAAALACDIRAGTSEALLADYSGFSARAVKAGGEIAHAHDDRAAEVEKLVGGWPKSKPVP